MCTGSARDEVKKEKNPPWEVLFFFSVLDSCPSLLSEERAKGANNEKRRLVGALDVVRFCLFSLSVS